VYGLPRQGGLNAYKTYYLFWQHSLYGICWDNKTLGMADEKYISKCEKATLDYEKMYLDENSLELVTTTESKHDGVFLA
jgi:hypothetical protein